MLKIQKTTASPAETIAFAEQLGKQLHAGDVIAYFGGLGVGKTTFTRGLAKGMGLPDVVSSPTFALVQEYHAAAELFDVADDVRREQHGVLPVGDEVLQLA